MVPYLNIEHEHISNIAFEDLLTYSDAWCEKLTDFNRKKESLLARFLLDRLCKKLGLGSIQECGFKKNENGKPYFSNKLDVHVSITHSDGFVWVTLANSPIGIDFEKVHIETKNELEIAFSKPDWKIVSNDVDIVFIYFSLKESYAKMIGTGFTTDPAKIELKFLRKNSFYTSIKSAYASYVLTLTALDFDPNDYIKSDFIKLCCFESF
jgi:phosphopantetheinyl transferase